VRPYEIIKAKRDGRPLPADEIRALVDGYMRGEVADYQMAAFCMAVFFRGMSDAETAALTDAMLRSGDVLDLSDLPGVKVDKHSTGGVGDKVSIALAPIAAACGVVVPMISGRGLGHTGGTLDKLEAIPGFRVRLPVERFREVLAETGACLIGQTDRLAPADRRLYALRDVTATVESIPLIASSIMSKKLAEGIDGLVLDVKVGSGAFMKRLEDGERLARALAAIGRGMGKRVVALLTGMDQPLGRAVGNALEVAESVEVLAGGGPADVVELTLALAREMLDAAGLSDVDPAGALRDGRAMDTWRAMLRAQGGDPDAPLPEAAEVEVVRSTVDGYVSTVDALAIGVAAWRAGAGRARKEDPVSAAAGVLLHRKPGDPVRAGDPLYELRADEPGRLAAARDAAAEAVTVAPSAPAEVPLVLERIA
jgi:thymidine phosphorylase